MLLACALQDYVQYTTTTNRRAVNQFSRFTVNCDVWDIAREVSRHRLVRTHDRIQIVASRHPEAPEPDKSLQSHSTNTKECGQEISRHNRAWDALLGMPTYENTSRLSLLRPLNLPERALMREPKLWAPVTFTGNSAPSPWKVFSFFCTTWTCGSVFCNVYLYIHEYIHRCIYIYTCICM